MDTAKVARIPNCDLPHPVPTPAYADAYIPTVRTWGFVCKHHFNKEGCSLGTGRGQVLIEVRS